MTSIEWLEEELAKNLKSIILNQDYRLMETLFEQAKEMHKQEIIDAWNGGDYAYFYSKETGRDFADGKEYYQETFVSKGSDKHKEKLKELYPDAYSILGEVLYKKCQFEPTTNISSATICKHCGREKYLHKI